jgi:hypothetical protein
LNPPKLITDAAPTLAGAHGSAWLIDRDTAMQRLGRQGDPRCSVSLKSWVVQAPWAHPLWSCYAVLCVALRDVPGVPAAKINLPGATHEVLLYALDPDHTPAVDEKPRPLIPVNFAGQFIEPSDEAADARIERAVQDVIDGKLNPDTDFRSQWVERFSASNVIKEAAPQFVAVKDGNAVIVSGTGAANVSALKAIVETQATLQADESKPQ